MFFFLRGQTTKLKLVFKEPNKLSFWWGQLTTGYCFVKAPFQSNSAVLLARFNQTGVPLRCGLFPYLFISPPAEETREAAGIKRPSTTSLGKQSQTLDGSYGGWILVSSDEGNLNKTLVFRPSCRFSLRRNSVHLVGRTIVYTSTQVLAGNFAVVVCKMILYHGWLGLPFVACVLSQWKELPMTYCTGSACAIRM